MIALRPFCAALLLSATVLAQSSNTTSIATPRQPTIKVTTRLVQINVLVHDHHGGPIGDLKKEDFEISDNGKTQTTAVFTVDSLTGDNNPSGLKARQPEMPRNVVTNRPERQANAPTSVTVLLLDMYNTKLDRSDVCQKANH